MDFLQRLTPLSVALCLLAVLVNASIFGYYLRAKRLGNFKQLPGPPASSWLGGNLGQLPKEKPWLKLKEWSDVYGPVYRLRLGTQDVLVISDAEHAVEIMDKRSNVYSSRPRMVVGDEYVSRGLRFVFMPFNDMWKRQRKLMHKLASPQAAATYEGMQELESTQFLADMVKQPKAHWPHCQRYASSFIMQVAFNKRAKSNQDYNVSKMRELINEIVQVTVPGRFLVDSFPLLRIVPAALARWKRTANDLFFRQDRLFQGHLRDVQKDMREGRDVHCFSRYLLEMQKDNKLSDQEIAFLGGVMYAAGSDTTSDGLSSAIMLLAKYPEAQRKAQKELDRVIGRERLPKFEDQSDLTYTMALVREVQRYRPIIPGGLPHATSEDDTWNGYHIPKGTTVIANTWAIHHDPKTYPEPEKFKPERFIGEKGELIGTPWAKRGHFGFGVRTELLWAFNVEPQKDVYGNFVPIDDFRYTSGFSSHPKDFQAVITPRFAGVEEIIRLQAEELLE